MAAMQTLLESINNVTSSVLRNLQDQHDWTSLQVQDTGAHRPLIRGLPPRRLYIHPDDQIAALSHEHKTGERLYQDPENEWVLAVHQAERWSMADFSAMFDSIGNDSARAKRITLATVHNDSTVVYYLIHEGMVKPRQN